jgi:hypothetical protein
MAFSSEEKSISSEEEKPIFTPKETSYDFGTIGEKEGFAEHIFAFTNTGTAPLVISQVQASCGCTKPEWTQIPVDPGQEGYIIITFNPRGRLGNFNKSATVYTNEKGSYTRHKLIITGNVVNKPEDPNVFFFDSIGGVAIESRNIVFDNVPYDTENKKSFYVKNCNPETVFLSWNNVPEYISVTSPDSVKPYWSNQITFTINKDKIQKGRYVGNIKLTINDSNKELASADLSSKVNVTDNFSGLSPLQNAGSARLDIKTAKIDFENLSNGFLGIIGSNNTREITINNYGKSDLILHSVTCDDKRVQLPNLKNKILKEGETFTFKAKINANDIESGLTSDIYIVCNDSYAPVRLIKVSAQKAK